MDVALKNNSGGGMQTGEHIVGFIDLGTNSVRLLLVRFNANHAFTVLSEQKETVRLGEGEFRRNLLQPEAMRRAATVCAKFAEIARSRGAGHVICVATSATREARNRGTFVRHIRRVAQVDCRVISGKEEARLIYLGVASGANIGGKETLFIDIGGGSTEVIVGDQQQYRFLDSLKLGAIRLTGNVLPSPARWGPSHRRSMPASSGMFARGRCEPCSDCGNSRSSR
jgi:exopolyphosphatase/guanosine-5'-triphosphate,3'-diphosphate pyrophosphatase